MGFDTKHEFAVPIDTIPDGHVVAMAIYGSLIAKYPDGHDVDGVAAIAGNANTQKTKVVVFIFTMPPQKVRHVHLSIGWW